MRSRAAVACGLAAAFGLAAAVGLAACGVMDPRPATAGPSAGPATADLDVYGAASLADVLEEARTAYEASHPRVTITVATGSSAALRTQIEQGAPADVFLSADTANPQALVDAGLADGEAVPFADNRLAIVAPADDPARIASPADLARPGVKVVAAGEEVPVSTYAARLVENLATLPGYPPGFAAAYASNIVSREDNARAVVAKVELGEGDAAIVYATDARASGKVVEIPIPAGANVRATYAGVVVGDAADVEAARTFLAWLAGPDGRAILAGFGFLAPS